MLKNGNLKEGILKDLENIYNLALKNENLSIALKAKELLGKELGLFSLKNSLLKKEEISLKNLSDSDINRLIEEIEELLALDSKECAQ